MGYGTKKYLYPLHITVDTVCAYYPLWNSDRCSKASSMNSFYCLAPPDSSLCSSPHVLFLIKAFRIFCRCIKTNMSTDDCQVGIYFRIALNMQKRPAASRASPHFSDISLLICTPYPRVLLLN